MNSVLHYLLIIFITALFTLLYFILLKLGVNRLFKNSLQGQFSMGQVYSSFLLRFLLAGIFFFILLKYYSELDEILIIVLTFIVVKFFIVKFFSKGDKGEH